MEKIFVRYVVDENILPISDSWEGNDLVFSSNFEKIALQKQTPSLHTHTTQIKIQHDKGSISGQRGRVHKPFMKQ